MSRAKKPAKTAKAPKVNGPPSTLTPDLTKRLIANVEFGLSKSAAAGLENVSKQLFDIWETRGHLSLEENEGRAVNEYARFALGVGQAIAKFQKEQVQTLKDAVGDPTIRYQIPKYLLAVRFPADFQHQPQVQAAPSTGGEFEHVSPDDALASIAAKLAEYIKQSAPEPIEPIVPAEAPTDGTA